MKILLMTPTWPTSERVIKKMMRVSSVSEILGLAYLAAILRRDGQHVEIFDAMAEECASNELSLRLRERGEFDIVGMIAFTPSINRVKENMQTLRHLYPRALLGIGGPHVNAMHRIGRAQEILDIIPQLDFAVWGEGELTLSEIVSRHSQGRTLDSVKGVIWRSSGKVIINSPRPLIENLDDLPFPAFDLLPLHRYHRTQSSCKREPVRSILTARGCPYTCIFCDRGAFGSKMRQRSVANVLAEVRMLVENFGTRELRINDEIFTLNTRFVNDFCQGLKPYKIPWTCHARINHMSKEIARMLKEAGCWAVDFGIESGNNRILKFINKRFTKEEALKTFAVAKDAGLEIRAFFILGFPGEDEATIKETIQFALDSPIDYATFYLPQPYPGTRLYEIAIEEKALVSQDWSDFLIEADRPTYVNPNFTSEKLIGYQSEAYRRFYKRPSLIYRHLRRIRSWKDIKRYASAVSVLKV